MKARTTYVAFKGMGAHIMIVIEVTILEGDGIFETGHKITLNIPLERELELTQVEL